MWMPIGPLLKQGSRSRTEYSFLPIWICRLLCRVFDYLVFQYNRSLYYRRRKPNTSRYRRQRACEVIILMNVLTELKERGIKIPFTRPKIRCKVFEENSECIEVAKEPKFRPRTKHLADYIISETMSREALNTFRRKIKSQISSPTTRSRSVSRRGTLAHVENVSSLAQFILRDNHGSIFRFVGGPKRSKTRGEQSNQSGSMERAMW